MLVGYLFEAADSGVSQRVEGGGEAPVQSADHAGAIVDLEGVGSVESGAHDCALVELAKLRDQFGYGHRVVSSNGSILESPPVPKVSSSKASELDSSSSNALRLASAELAASTAVVRATVSYRVTAYLIVAHPGKIRRSGDHEDEEVAFEVARGGVSRPKAWFGRSSANSQSFQACD